MPFQKDNILQFNQYLKSGKMPYIVYDDLDYLIKKVDGCADSPEKYSTKKVIFSGIQCQLYEILII